MVRWTHSSGGTAAPRRHPVKAHDGLRERLQNEREQPGQPHGMVAGARSVTSLRSGRRRDIDAPRGGRRSGSISSWEKPEGNRRSCCGWRWKDLEATTGSKVQAFGKVRDDKGSAYLQGQRGCVDRQKLRFALGGHPCREQVCFESRLC